MIGKNSARRKNPVFQPALFEKLDDLTIKSSPKELKFWGDEDDDFKNPSPKDLHENPHGLTGIEENRNKNGVFSRNAFHPATFGNLDDWTINSSPKELKF